MSSIKYTKRPNFRFGNFGLQSESRDFDLMLAFSEISLTEDDIIFHIFIAVQYLIHYLELMSFNRSTLLHSIIESHLNSLTSLLKFFDKIGKRYLDSEYVKMVKFVEKAFYTTSDNVIRQFSLDQMERICLFLNDKTYLMKVCPNIKRDIHEYGVNLRTRVIYASFFIPKLSNILNKIHYLDQKFFQKTERACFCRTKIWRDTDRCFYDSNYMTLEVIFDVYHGNFIGFLDSLSYCIKVIDSQCHFIKSSRIIMFHNNLKYVFLSDVPFQELRLIEKTVKPGALFTPFLDKNAMSKLIYAEYTQTMLNREHKKLTDYLESGYREKFIEEHEEMEFWKQFDTFSNRDSYEYMVLQFLDSYTLWKAICLDFHEFRRRIIQYTEEDNDSGESEGQAIVKIIKRQTNDEEIIDKDIDNLFFKMYSRRFDYSNEPDWALNHVLRAVMRCETELTKDEFRLIEYKAKKALPSETLVDITKKMYEALWRNRAIAENYIGLESQKLERSSFCVKANMTDNQPKEESSNTEDLISQLSQPSLKEIKNTTKVHINRHKDDITGNSETINSDKRSAVQSVLEEPSLLQDDFHDIFESIRQGLKQDFSLNFMNRLVGTFGERHPLTFSIFKEDEQTEKKFTMKLLQLSESGTFKKRLLFEQPQDFDDLYKFSVNQDIVDLVKTDFLTNIYVTMRIITDNEVNELDKIIKLVSGRPLNLRFFQRISEANEIYFVKSFLPKFKSPINRLSHLINSLIYDVYLLCYTQNTMVKMCFKKHLKELYITNDELHDEFHILFDLVGLFPKLENMDRLLVEKYAIFNVQACIELNLFLKQLHELIFNERAIVQLSSGCKILFMSLKFNELSGKSLFIKKSGSDRRIRRIENMCHCLITMKSVQHRITSINEYLVEIYFNSITGDSWKCKDMMKTSLAESSCIKTYAYRCLVLLPTGEVWFNPNIDWLRNNWEVLNNYSGSKSPSLSRKPIGPTDIEECIRQANLDKIRKLVGR